jgi:hypothetical protein
MFVFVRRCPEIFISEDMRPPTSLVRTITYYVQLITKVGLGGGVKLTDGVYVLNLKYKINFIKKQFSRGCTLYVRRY